jgi:hypothetical protein
MSRYGRFSAFAETYIHLPSIRPTKANTLNIGVAAGWACTAAVVSVLIHLVRKLAAEPNRLAIPATREARHGPRIQTMVLDVGWD